MLAQILSAPRGRIRCTPGETCPQNLVEERGRNAILLRPVEAACQPRPVSGRAGVVEGRRGLAQLESPTQFTGNGSRCEGVVRPFRLVEIEDGGHWPLVFVIE